MADTRGDSTVRQDSHGRSALYLALAAVAILVVSYLLVSRGIVAARSSQDRLGTYLCMLVLAWLTGQMAINVGMVLGRLPTIGVPLPLVSYGGSSLVATLFGSPSQRETASPRAPSPSRSTASTQRRSVPSTIASAENRS